MKVNVDTAIFTEPFYLMNTSIIPHESFAILSVERI